MGFLTRRVHIAVSTVLPLPRIIRLSIRQVDTVFAVSFRGEVMRQTRISSLEERHRYRLMEV